MILSLVEYGRGSDLMHGTAMMAVKKIIAGKSGCRGGRFNEEIKKI